jgi:hypothetical protein
MNTIGCLLGRCAFAVLGLLLMAAVYGQDYRGRIQGTVLDSSQAAIVGAEVIITNLDTNVTATRPTNATGHFIFDLVEPGRYNVSIQSPGFNAFRQESVVLTQRGDATVDAVLKVGNVSDTVSVTAEAAQVQFNNARLETSVDSKIADSLPQYFRDPLLLSKLDPMVAGNDTNTERRPFNSLSTSGQSVGGQASASYQVDGASVNIGVWSGYVPPPDSVQEVNILVNAVDAEFGRGPGGAVTVTTKSGTNQYHGLGYYQGAYPWLNAKLNRVTNVSSIARTHIFGGNFGGPIKRDKVFNFFSFEGWQFTDPQQLNFTVPTALERIGDFSQSLNTAGNLRAIYDPNTTQTTNNGATITRTPFVGNVIPLTRQSFVARQYVAVLEQPTTNGTGNYHTNNYAVPLPLFYPYRNYSDRGDWVISSTMRASGHVSIFKTPSQTSNPTGSDLAYHNNRATDRDSSNIGGEFTWLKSARTVISVGFAHLYIQDSATLRSCDWAGYPSLWPNSKWYEGMFANKSYDYCSPGMNITGTGGNLLMGTSNFYYKKTSYQNTTNLKIAQQLGKHYLKSGLEIVYNNTPQLSALMWPAFPFAAGETSSTYLNSPTQVSGDGFASFLVGAPTNGGNFPNFVRTAIKAHSYAAFINDDFKLTRNLTVTLGLRWERDGAFTEPDDRLAKGLDLTVPIPALQGANAPAKPAAVSQFYSGPWTFNGAFRWTENGSGQWNAGSGVFSPRFGLAYRIDNKSSLRFGWGMYVTPILISSNITQGNFYGFNVDNQVPPSVLGIPQMSLDNPFPSSFPLTLSTGKTLGNYTGMGDSLTWYAADRPRQYTHRFNISAQRELPGGFVVDFVAFLNISNAPASRNINQVDPRIALTYGAATNVAVANPFYQLLPATQMPGPLRYQPTVSLASLMVPYPQYGALNVTDYEDNGGTVFKEWAIKFQRRYSKGISITGGYANQHARNLNYYDNVSTYVQARNWQTDPQPVHRFTFGGLIELPAGRGRPFLSKLPRFVDAIVGGWNLSPAITWRSGNLLIFPGMLVNGDPRIDNPGPDGWFNTKVFAQLPNFTRRTNPAYYDGIRGPRWFDLDLSAVKSFRLTEKFSAELRMDTLNTPNSMTWNDPSTAITSSTFGKSNNQFLANGIGVGRQTQISMRIRF